MYAHLPRDGLEKGLLHILRHDKGRKIRMKWDFAIGNPPYQQETENISLTNGQLRSKSVFHFFQIEADKIARESTVLIYPAGRWIQRSGKGMASFGLEQINDHRLSKVYFYRTL